MEPARALNDRAALPDDVNEALEAALDQDETIDLILPGLDRSAIIGTDRRLFMARRGELVGAGSGSPAAWAYQQFRRVQFETDRIAGTLMLLPTDPQDRGLVLLFDQASAERARLGALRLREKLQAAGSYDPAAEDDALEG